MGVYVCAAEATTSLRRFVAATPTQSPNAIAIANINDDRKMQNVHSVVVSFRFCM